MEWKEDSDYLRMWPNKVYARSGYVAGNYVFPNAHNVLVGYHVSGSGPLNGEKMWPHVAIHVSFPTGREETAKLFAEKMRSFIDDFLTTHNLNPPEDTE